MSYLNYHQGSLVFGPSGKVLRDFAVAYQGPTYIYDLGFVRERYQQMSRALPQVEIYYAMKANSHPDVLRTLAAAGAGADVVSAGEIRRALECGFTPERIVYSGVGKTRAEIRYALTTGVAQLNVESQPELLRILEIARELKISAPVALRLNPDVDIKTHPYIATGLKDNKFGMELSLLPELKQLLNDNREHLLLRGVSLHLGSQMLEFTAFREALEKLRPIYQDLQKSFPEMNVFDFGGGLGIFYEKQDLAEEEALLNEYARVALEVLAPLGARLQSEPGRWLVAHAGVLLTQVQYIKKTSHKTFVIVDTGMNHLLRPSLYGSYHGIWPLKESDRRFTADLVGPICESGDFFAKDRELPELAPDDFLVLADTGAYGYSMANTYNLQDLPKEVCF